MQNIKRLAADGYGLVRVCGIAVALRWLSLVLLESGGILRCRNLQPPGRAMGGSPKCVMLGRYRIRFRVEGTGAISGIREMYVRNQYLGHGTLAIQDGDAVVDLGVNMSNSTNLALAHGSRVRSGRGWWMPWWA